MALDTETCQLVESGGDRDRIISEGVYRKRSDREYRKVEGTNKGME